MHVNGKSRNWGWDGNDKIIDAADRLDIDNAKMIAEAIFYSNAKKLYNLKSNKNK